MVERSPDGSGVRGRLTSGLVGFATLACLLVATPELLRALGPVVVVTGPFLSVGLLAARRIVRDQKLRALLLGASVGFGLIFLYGFSPPVLERIGHAIGWPGTTLRLWERFTAPVYNDCCTSPWFWRIFELWDILTLMMVDHLDGSFTSLIIPALILPAAIALGVVHLRKNRIPGDDESQARTGHPAG